MSTFAERLAAQHEVEPLVAIRTPLPANRQDPLLPRLPIECLGRLRELHPFATAGLLSRANRLDELVWQSGRDADHSRHFSFVDVQRGKAPATAFDSGRQSARSRSHNNYVPLLIPRALGRRARLCLYIQFFHSDHFNC